MGCIRSLENEKGLVLLLSDKNGFIDDEYRSLLKAAGVSGKYCVVFMDKVKKEVYGFETFIEAQGKYIELCDEYCGEIKKTWEISKNKLDIQNDLKYA